MPGKHVHDVILPCVTTVLDNDPTPNRPEWLRPDRCTHLYPMITFPMITAVWVHETARMHDRTEAIELVERRRHLVGSE